MQSPSSRDTLARCCAFRGLPRVYLDPLSVRLTYFIAVMGFIGTAGSSVLNALAGDSLLPMLTPLAVVAAIIFSFARGTAVSGRTRLSGLAIIVLGLGVVGVFRFNTLFAASMEFVLAVILLSLAWGGLRSTLVVVGVATATFALLHPWYEGPNVFYALLPLYICAAFLFAIGAVTSLVAATLVDLIEDAAEGSRQQSLKLRTLQSLITKLKGTDSLRPQIQTANDPVSELLPDERILLAAEGHLTRGSAVMIDLFTPKRLLKLICDGLDASAVARDVKVHVSNRFPANSVCLADAGRLAAVISRLVQDSAIRGVARNVWIDVASRDMDDDRTTLQIRIEDDGDSLDYTRMRLIGGDGANMAQSSIDLDLGLVGQWLNDLEVMPQFGVSKWGGMAVGFDVIVDVISLPTDQERGNVIKLQPVVLVVEDDPVQRSSIANMVELVFGATIVTASTAREALEVMETRVVDLVITDYFMPGMDGAELVSMLKSAGQHMPVVAVTKASSGAEQQALWQAGVDLVLPKPITAEAIEAAMGRYLVH